MNENDDTFPRALLRAHAPYAVLAEMVGPDEAHSLIAVRRYRALSLTSAETYAQQVSRCVRAMGLSPCEVAQVAASLEAGRRLYFAPCDEAVCCDG